MLLLCLGGTEALNTAHIENDGVVNDTIDRR
jgi:hypothetical protein